MSMLPMGVYGLQVPCGDLIVPAIDEEEMIQCPVRITMAAIDPTAAPSGDGETPRATLKILRMRVDPEAEESDDDDDDDDGVDAIRARLMGAASDDEEDEELSDDDEKNGGPSDPSKTKKARLEAAAKELINTLKNGDDMDVDNAPNGVNGILKNKGKAKATDLDDLDDDEDDDENDMEVEEFVVCTLDLTKNYQQPLDLTIGDGERVFFRVTGTHDIYLTGNFVAPPDDDTDDEDMEGDYGLSPYQDELEDEVEYDEDDEEEDELDDIDDPRIAEILSEEEAPQLVTASKSEKKGKNKRPAEEPEEDAGTLDDLINKSLKPADATANGEQKLSKKQLKKLKNNAGQAVAATVPKDEAAKKEQATGGAKESKSDKKVQFAKNLEQGPTPSPKPKPDTKADAKTEGKKDDKPKPALGVKVVQGVKIDDKKLGSGPAAKKGDKIGMRYIGKLESNNKQFDANKKGKPFTFKLGVGEVIKGWDIGVAGMQVGGERRITIPASLGYGSKGVPGIPPNSNLVFDIKMLSLN